MVVDSFLTCGSGNNLSWQELADVVDAATVDFLVSVLSLLLLFPSRAWTSAGGGGKGLRVATLD